MNSDKNKHLIVVAGPTASGKTKFAIALAKYFNTEIISADSRQCFKEMNIGTAKPTAAEQAQVKHYFVNTHSITDDVNVAEYEQYALKVLSEIFKEKDYAVVCGGTGLYINALCHGIDEMPQINKEIEQKITEQYKKNGLIWLQKETQKHDPVFFANTEQQNPARLLRALVFKLSNHQSITKYKSGTKKERPFTITKIALDLPREILYHRINLRVDNMIKEGLLQEVEALFPYRHLKSMQTVGYAEFYENENFPPTGKELESSVEKIKQHTRNYAKRQITWFKKDKEFHWLSPQNIEEAIKLIEEKNKL